MAKEIAFSELIRKHQALLYKVSSVYTNTKEDQEDLFQEIVYQLWRYFDTFRNESKITTWMYRVGMNTAITYLKKAKKKNLNAIPISEAVIGACEVVDEVYEERLKQLYHHMQYLNPIEKGLMLLLLEGKSYKEMAEITGLSNANIGTKISRIKTKLRNNMTKS